jgi:protein-disulfide isomerase
VIKIPRVTQRAPSRWLVIGLAISGSTALWFLSPVGSLVGSMTADAQTSQTPVPDSDFDRRVRAFLLKHPEVIVEAMQRYEVQQRADQVKAARQLLKSRATDILQDPASPVGGNPKGDATLVEFFDYNCPYCRRVVPDMLKLEEADAKVRVVYKEFPILGPNSTFAAKAALAAHRQGKYIELHRALLKARGSVTKATVLKTASSLGLDIDRLQKDMVDPAILAALERNSSLARALGINGTPAFIIDQKIVSGAIDLAAMQELVTKTRDAK